MFEVVREIEGGEHLLSSLRHFVMKIDARLIFPQTSHSKSPNLTLHLFNDFLVVSPNNCLIL